MERFLGGEDLLADVQVVDDEGSPLELEVDVEEVRAAHRGAPGGVVDQDGHLQLGEWEVGQLPEGVLELLGAHPGDCELGHLLVVLAGELVEGALGEVTVGLVDVGLVSDLIC